MGTKLFHEDDPGGRSGRTLDDQRFALDHYYKKLRHLAYQVNTRTARAMARDRASLFARFVETLLCEAYDDLPRLSTVTRTR
jgi:HD superfamily phosphodiesterase